MKQLQDGLNNKGISTFFFVLALVIFLMNGKAIAQDDLTVIKWLKYSDAPNLLNHYLTEEAKRFLDVRAKTVARINTPGEWKKRQATLKKTMWNLLGPFPEKTPLNARITGTVEKDGYRIENIMYESLPGFYVTASLFIPNNLQKPTPAILFCSGHSAAVYRLPSYQQPLLNLVKKGFIVLAIDPLGQGERVQYFDKDSAKSLVGSSTVEHSYAGVQVSLIGKSIARYFTWDGIRGIDYLVSRREVDPKRIGVQGISGGGTQISFIAALDERVAASAPSNYITSYQRLMESQGVQDGEQNFYHGISSGLDHGDFVEIRAPKPMLIMATTRDFFSIQGVRETFAEAKKVYEIFGKPLNLQKVEDDYGHQYTQKNDEAMYAFFQKSLQLPGSSTDDKVQFVPASELQKTTTGQLASSLGGETVFSLNSKEAEKLVDRLEESRKDILKHIPRVLKSARTLSGYHDPTVFHDPVFTGRFQKEGYVIEKYFIKGEGDYVIPYLLMIPEKPNNKALLYLHPSGKLKEAGPGGEIEWFVKKGFTVLAPDLIGVGEVGPPDTKSYSSGSGMPYSMLFAAMLIGRSIVGIRAGDVVRLTGLLKKNALVKEVYALARKDMAPVLLHAAAFDATISRIALIEPYSSYRTIVMNRFYNPDYIYSMVPGALAAYDLPDLAVSLSPRKLMIINITDGSGKMMEGDSIKQDIDFIKAGYHSRKADEQLNINSSPFMDKPYDLLSDWIK
ncbi:MAG: alpha/beta hydrolase family protein [Chitinophagaceae bacterium]